MDGDDCTLEVYKSVLLLGHKHTLTDPMSFCCLVDSAMKLQASTHSFISGAVFARLL